jgi:hypothetical protein
MHTVVGDHGSSTELFVQRDRMVTCLRPAIIDGTRSLALISYTKLRSSWSCRASQVCLCRRFVGICVVLEDQGRAAKSRVPAFGDRDPRRGTLLANF